MTSTSVHEISPNQWQNQLIDVVCGGTDQVLNVWGDQTMFSQHQKNYCPRKTNRKWAVLFISPHQHSSDWEGIRVHQIRPLTQQAPLDDWDMLTGRRDFLKDQWSILARCMHYITLKFKVTKCLALQSLHSHLWERSGKQMCLEFSLE